MYCTINKVEDALCKVRRKTVETVKENGFADLQFGILLQLFVVTQLSH